MKKLVGFIVAFCLVTGVSFYALNLEGNADTEYEKTSQVIQNTVAVPKATDVNEVIKKTPKSVTKKLKMPKDLPFKVNKVEARVEDKYQTDAINSKRSENEKIPVKQQIDTQKLPPEQIAYEQIFHGENITLSVLVDASEVEVVYGNPGEVEKIKLTNGQTVDYIDYGSIQLINWLDTETGFHYSINAYINDGENSKLTKKDIVTLIESFEISF